MRGTALAVPALVLGVMTTGSITGNAAIGSSTVLAARTTVTIDAEGTDMFGTVSSPRPRRCAKDRKVIVFKQVGTRGGGDDINFASDNASKEGGVFRWSTGNTGTEGRFYARVRPIDGCKGDTSETIRVTRST